MDAEMDSAHSNKLNWSFARFGRPEYVLGRLKVGCKTEQNWKPIQVHISGVWMRVRKVHLVSIVCADTWQVVSEVRRSRIRVQHTAGEESKKEALCSQEDSGAHNVGPGPRKCSSLQGHHLIELDRDTLHTRLSSSHECTPETGAVLLRWCRLCQLDLLSMDCRRLRLLLLLILIMARASRVRALPVESQS
uniref:Uncharacterized protein n=1 Tax=Ananas comosus var. bracteatus TaxID=296719 RepID=A0A6V7NYQ2_ANACO|nr:unnamed protein product [Ananas comosus var. bracteatus]